MTEGTPGCFWPIVYRTRSTSTTLDVTVEGLAEPSPVCRAITPSAFRVALPAANVQIRVEHRGETDVYEIEPTEAGLGLVAVRTSTTRLGPR